MNWLPEGTTAARRSAARKSCAPIRIDTLEARVLWSASALPRPDHVVVVIEEDHSYDQILGASVPNHMVWATVLPSALNEDPYLRQLAANGASMTHMNSVGNRNDVTYQALFSGLNPPGESLGPSSAPNIASELDAAGFSFGGYSESLPHVGYTGGSSGFYTVAHNAWVSFTNVPASENLPFSKFPHNFNDLPTVSYVVPDSDDNMHSGSVRNADRWLQQNVDDYAEWALKHNSLLIVTWDESHVPGDSIPTIFFGPMVEPGKYSEPVTQRNLLRTIEDMYGLTPTGLSADAAPITDIWTPGGVKDSVADQAAASEKRHRGKASIAGTIGALAAQPLTPFAALAPQNGWQVYVDTNDNGLYDSGEPTARSNRAGRFRLRNLSAGTQAVRVVPRTGYLVQDPSTGAIQVTLTAKQHISGINFSTQAIQ